MRVAMRLPSFLILLTVLMPGVAGAGIAADLGSAGVDLAQCASRSSRQADGLER